MAARDPITPTTRPGGYQPPAWLSYYVDAGVVPDEQSLVRAVDAYAASMDALLDILSDGDAPDGAKDLALDGYHKTQDMRAFLAHWRATQCRGASAVEVEANDDSDAEAGAGAPPASDARYSNAQEQSLDQIESLRRVFSVLTEAVENALFGHDAVADQRFLRNVTAELAPRGAAVVEELYGRLERIPVSRELAEELA